jgi:demethylmenaquinone methyltransferase/2-methoxy-6-polyprenyl-1,4-benzoquinol methylase/phosphoethanolamine N-methyltransferase
MPHHHAHSGNRQDKSLSTKGSTIHWARFYDFSVNLLALGTEKRLREVTIAQAQIQPGDDVLDVGCGTGNLTLLAKKAAGPTGAVFGIDAAPEMIEVAASKARKAGVNANFSHGVVEKLEFQDERFDLILSSLMVHHLPGDDLKSKAFGEMYRVLKPGANLLIIDFAPPKSRFIRWLLQPVLKGMLAYDIRSNIPLLEEVGFTRIESGSTGHRLASFVSARKVQVY